MESRDGEIRTAVEQNGILTITLNRPSSLNALTRAMLLELGQIFDEAGADDSVRVIVLTGEGRGFCSGADAHGLAASASQSVEERLAERPRFTPRQCGIYKPSICAVNGVCAGAGLHFVSDMDIVIASELASFTDTHVNVGQVTAMEPVALAKRSPLGSVLRMVTLGKAERLSATQAKEIHLISEIVAPDRLMLRARELAAIIAEVSPAAVQASLKVLWDSFEPGVSQAHERGFEAVMRHRDHPDATEGPAAFLQKRKPRWSPK